jgi:hypothetical protein
LHRRADFREIAEIQFKDMGGPDFLSFLIDRVPRAMDGGEFRTVSESVWSLCSRDRLDELRDCGDADLRTSPMRDLCSRIATGTAAPTSKTQPGYVDVLLNIEKCYGNSSVFSPMVKTVHPNLLASTVERILCRGNFSVCGSTVSIDGWDEPFLLGAFRVQAQIVAVRANENIPSVSVDTDKDSFGMFLSGTVKSYEDGVLVPGVLLGTTEMESPTFVPLEALTRPSLANAGLRFLSHGKVVSWAAVMEASDHNRCDQNQEGRESAVRSVAARYKKAIVLGSREEDALAAAEAETDAETETRSGGAADQQQDPETVPVPRPPEENAREGSATAARRDTAHESNTAVKKRTSAEAQWTPRKKRRVSQTGDDPFA